MWGSSACAAAGGRAGRTGRPGRGRRPAHQHRASTCKATPKPAGWAAGRGQAAPDHLSERVRGSPVATDGGACWPGSRSITREGVGGGAPAELLPAAGPASRQRHGRARSRTVPPFIVPFARHSRSSSPAARCRAPDTAGRAGCRGWRPAGRGCGTPASANRRSAGCTDGRRWASASRRTCGPCRTPIRGGMLISPGRRVFWRPTRRHRPWPGCQAPTNPPSGWTRPGRSRMARPPYSPRSGSAGQALGSAGNPKARRPARNLLAILRSG
jgi:hypothetical protein